MQDWSQQSNRYSIYQPPTKMSFEHCTSRYMLAADGFQAQMTNVKNEAVRHCRTRSISLKTSKAGE